MDLSSRVSLRAVLVTGALLVGCGSSDQPSDDGSPGGAGGGGGAGGSGGAGGAAMPDASDDTTDPTTPDGAPAGDAARDGMVTSDANPEDLVREMINRLQPVEAEARCRELESKSVPDRFTKSANFTAITEWVRDLIQAEGTGAVVRFDEWEGYRNIEITIPGSDPSAGMYILGGHLDSVKGTVGMDDNGSGAMGVALMARALSHYRYKAEIRCLLFDAEEGGLIGSDHYAKALRATGCEGAACVKVYINLDEVAYDPQSRRGLRVWSDSTELKNLQSEVNTKYALGLSLTLGTGSCHRSDDCSFADQGYPTIYNFQATQSPYYHMPGDTADTLNYETLTKVLQLSAGAVATAAVPLARYP